MDSSEKSMNLQDTSSFSEPGKSPISLLSSASQSPFPSPTPPSLSLTREPPTPSPLPPPIPQDLTQAQVQANPPLQRLQTDLLILTALNENETLHWRPSWFEQGDHAHSFWTLYNPPNVVTESLPRVPRGRRYFTRRMRREDDPPAFFIKSWDAWHRYRKLRGIPRGFLGEEQIRLLRLGLARDSAGKLCPPPSHPLYPEPQPLGCGRYILHPCTYRTHLPPKFHHVDCETEIAHGAQVVVVHANGALLVETYRPFFLPPSKWPHSRSHASLQHLRPHLPGESGLTQQGPGRRWSYLPWTAEQEETCKASLVVKLKIGGIKLGE